MNSVFKYFTNQTNQLSEYITHLFTLMPKHLQQKHCRKTIDLKCLYSRLAVFQKELVSVFQFPSTLASFG